MRCALTALTAACVALPALAQPGRVIAIGDEWLLSDEAFVQQPGQSAQLATNIAGYFNGSTGNFLVLSNSSAITFPGQRGVLGDGLANVMINAGRSWIVNPEEFTLSLAALQSYDAVFFSGTAGSGTANASILAQYVNGGGNVLVMAGTGDFGSPEAEANAWNPFLNQFGLGFGGSWFGLRQGPNLLNVPTLPSTHPLGSFINGVQWDYGQTAFDLDSNDPLNEVALLGNFTGFASPPDTAGAVAPIIATYNVPLPAPGAATLLALGSLSLARRRRH